MELWKQLPYESCYEASTEGRIRHKLRDGTYHYMTLTPTENGYLMTSKRILTADGYRTGDVQRIIAFVFHPETADISAQVNHINEIKNDNRPDNLEWVSRKVNNNYGNHSANISASLSGKKKHNRGVVQLDSNYSYVAHFATGQQAAEEYCVTRAAISDAKWKGHKCCGFYWIDTETYERMAMETNDMEVAL